MDIYLIFSLGMEHFQTIKEILSQSRRVESGEGLIKILDATGKFEFLKSFKCRYGVYFTNKGTV